MDEEDRKDLEEAIEDVIDEVIFDEPIDFPIVLEGEILGSANVTEEGRTIILELRLDKKQFLMLVTQENGLQKFISAMLNPEDQTPDEN